MKCLRGKLTYANVISTLCLCLLVGGGTAFAATKLAKNSVGTKQIKNNAITGAKIKKHAVTASKIAPGAISSVPTATNAVHATSADSAGTATNAGTAGSANNLAGFARKGLTRVSASGAASFEVGLGTAPQTVLFGAGPFTVYAQCIDDGTDTYAAVSIRTSINGAIFYGEDDYLTGDPKYLDTDTAPRPRVLEYEDVAANSAYFENEDGRFAAMAPDGTAVSGDFQLGMKKGNLAAGNGIWGAGDVCLFSGEMTTLNG